jgi:hypothetical protein
MANGKQGSIFRFARNCTDALDNFLESADNIYERFPPFKASSIVPFFKPFNP